jgi:hypothetical protein
VNTRTTRTTATGDTDDEPQLYDVILVARNQRHILLQLPRTAVEIEALRAKGHMVIGCPTKPKPTSNGWAPNPYSQALRAVMELYRHAEGSSNVDLQARAADAMRALLRGQAGWDGGGERSSARIPIAQPFARTIPGVGR